jgi:hypothetical protein
MKLLHFMAAAALLALTGCHPGPVVGGPKPAAVGGTIAGIVSTAANTPIANRKVTAIETTTGARHEALTGSNGGYTIKLPQGTYRLEVELQAGERVARQPDETRITGSDLDTRRDFVITGG